MADTLRYIKESSYIIREALEHKEYTVKLHAKGSSMNPLIKEGDTIVIKPATFRETGIGDILVFDAGGNLCAHRLIMKYFKHGHSILVTKADETFVVDFPFGEKKLVGKVSCVERGAAKLNLESVSSIFINRVLGLYHLFIVVTRNALKRLC